MIVVIPCWRRPEMLGACLVQIAAARDAKRQRYVFVVDRNPDPQVFEVIGSFPFTSTIIKRGDHGFDGPRYNILEGYRLALEIAVRHDEPLIALIEDDVLVSNDVFEFFEDASSFFDAAIPCVSACRNQNIDDAKYAGVLRAGGPQAIYPHKSFQSMAVCHDRAFVAEFLAHAGADYYADPINYCKRELPDQGLPDYAASQDGLIHRVIRGAHRFMLYPCEPRAFHVGWYGFNRAQGVPLWQSIGDASDFAGDWRFQRDWILQASNEQLNRRADPRFRDIERCSLIRPRQELKLV